MRLALIAAMASNRVIGRNNQLPWYLPGDLKYFKQITMGKPLIMGRKTFESIGKPLPGRANIIVTRNPEFQFSGVTIVGSLEQAIEHAEAVALIDGVDEAMVIGGAELYALALPEADRLYLTQVHAEVDGNVWFPEFDATVWQEVARENFDAEDPNPYDYSFVVLDRIYS